MTNEHPITPPPELVQQWWEEADQDCDRDDPKNYFDYIATQAARWGADQELWACCEQLVQLVRGDRMVEFLRATRRPTPQPPADGDASTVIPWLLEMAVMAANSDSPYSAGMLTLAAQLIGEGVDEDAPSPPVDGEVADLVAALKVIDKMQNEWILLGNDDGTASPSLTMPISLRRFTVIRDALSRAAELLQRQHLQPVPVSERPPLSHECDEDGHLWLGVLETDALLGCPHFSLWSYDESRKRLGGSYTHFLPYNTPLLPAHALPLPTSEEVEA